MKVEFTAFRSAHELISQRKKKTHSAVAVMEKVPVQVGGYNDVINGKLLVFGGNTIKHTTKE